MSAYGEMKTMYEFASILNECVKPGFKNAKNYHRKRLSLLADKHKAKVRASMKKISDPIMFPLTRESRIHYPKDDYESWTEYGIMEDKGWSYQTLKEYFDDMYVDVRCDYSPTGRPYTHYIHWKRTPVGIAYVIYWGLDV